MISVSISHSHWRGQHPKVVTLKDRALLNKKENCLALCLCISALEGDFDALLHLLGRETKQREVAEQRETEMGCLDSSTGQGAEERRFGGA